MDQCTSILKDRSQMEDSYEDCKMQKSYLRPDGGGNAMKCLESMLKQVLSGKSTLMRTFSR